MNYTFFDLETTGLDTFKDRIVQIGVVVTDENLQVLISEKYLLNPGIPIAPEASAVHGIYDHHVVNKPSFADVAPELAKWFETNCIAGYNILKFDMPMLYSEFKRWRVKSNKPMVKISKNIIDMFNIEAALHPRTLEAVFHNYTGGWFADAHDALADVNATLTIFSHQKPLIKEQEKPIKQLSKSEDIVDFSGYLTMIGGHICFNFGKYKGEPIHAQRAYAQWVCNSDFPEDTKDILRENL